MSFSNTLHHLKYFKFVISIGVFKTEIHTSRLVGVLLEILLNSQS